MISEPPRAEPADVRVWHATTDETWRDAARRPRALAWLQPHERARYDRYRRDLDRDMFLLGRVMARTLVARALDTAPLAWTWLEGARGRPEVGAPPPASRSCSFNLAHSGGVVVCAVGHGRAVGVDVEDRQRAPLDPQIVRRFCSPAEIADIESRGLNGWHDPFLKYRTFKEAYLKARGLGIAVPLADLSFSVRDPIPRVEFRNAFADSADRWAFHLTELGPRHYLAVGAAADRHAPAFSVEPYPSDLLP
jgi:4'-phosphopantetheinyl transferase